MGYRSAASRVAKGADCRTRPGRLCRNQYHAYYAVNASGWLVLTAFVAEAALLFIIGSLYAKLLPWSTNPRKT